MIIGIRRLWPAEPPSEGGDDGETLDILPEGTAAGLRGAE
jgi:hypothetical protein